MSKPKEQTAKEISDKVQEAAAELHRIYQPQWDARGDVLKTIVSLSSASIVLSVTFSSSLRDLHLSPVWRYLVLTSFGGLVASLIFAVVALWTGTRVYELQSGMFDTRKAILKAVSESATYDQFMDKFVPIQNRVNVRIGNSDKLATRLFHLSLAFFCLALVILAMVGAQQFLN